MGAHFSRANVIDDLNADLLKIPGAIASVDADLAQLAEQSANEMKDYIGTRGTDYSNSQGRSGRVDPARADPTMQDAVGFRRIPKPAPTVYIWEFGWLDNFMAYFGFQEKGFMHLNGKAVTPMLALRDASTNARDRMVLLVPIIIGRASGVLKAGNHGWV